jgi:hypothetical protein
VGRDHRQRPIWAFLLVTGDRVAGYTHRPITLLAVKWLLPILFRLFSLRYPDACRDTSTGNNTLILLAQ